MRAVGLQKKMRMRIRDVEELLIFFSVAVENWDEFVVKIGAQVGFGV
jgi:hypothetical protein